MNEGVCFIQLGRFGDLILMLPVFQAVYQRTGFKPFVVVSDEYASVLEGVGYVSPVPVDCHWWKDMARAREIAEQFGLPVVIPQWWNSGDKEPVPSTARGQFPVVCHGKEFHVNRNVWPNYMASMWAQCGFTIKEMNELPVVFNWRDRDREWALLQEVRRYRRKPMLLVNWTGISSPFAAMPEYMRVIQRFESQFQIVNLGTLRAERIYDLLGLYDAAAGLITIDTATLHLAGAGNVEYVAFTRSDWSGSVPKGKCVLEVGYDGAEQQAEKLVPILHRWAGAPQQKPVLQFSGGGGGMLKV